MSDKRKYDEGDKVILLPRALAKNIGPQLDAELGCNRCVTIPKKHLAGTYQIDFAKREYAYNITDADILGYAFMYNEEIEVRDYEGELWRTRRFKSYRPGKGLPFNAGTEVYAQARPIRKPIIEVTVKVNGKGVDASAISEETWANLRGKK